MRRCSRRMQDSLSLMKTRAWPSLHWLGFPLEDRMKPDCCRPIAAGMVAFVLALTACQEETTSPDISPSSQNSAATAAAANYTVTDLGSLGGGLTEAFAINNAGQVVGYSELPDGER